MLRILEKVTNSLYAIYANRDDFDSNSFGYFIKITDEYTLIKHIDRSGKYDGYKVIRTEDIYRIEKNSKYTNKIIQLMMHKENADNNGFHSIEIENPLVDLIEFAKHNKRIVGLCIEEDTSEYIYGYITDFKEDELAISQVTVFAEADGEATLSINDVKEIYFDDYYCTDLEILLNNY